MNVEKTLNRHMAVVECSQQAERVSKRLSAVRHTKVVLSGCSERCA